jgi:hypothetical protein
VAILPGCQQSQQCWNIPSSSAEAAMLEYSLKSVQQRQP